MKDDSVNDGDASQQDDDPRTAAFELIVVDAETSEAGPGTSL